MKPRPSPDPEFEVLPPEKEEPVSGETLLRMVAFIMDNLFTVPGTKLKFGLDPILGLIPGLGDTSSAFVSCLSIGLAAKEGIPRIALVRMALNVILNALGGAIPGLGDLFSLWFKSNQRNYELLLKYTSQKNPASTRADWMFVISLIAIVAIAILLISIGTLFVLYQFLHFLGWLIGF